MTTIKTKKFILRHINISDAKAYFESMSDPVTKKGFTSTPKNLSEAKKEVKKMIDNYKKKPVVSEALVIEVDKKYAGFITIEYFNWKPNHRGRIHYCIHQKFRGLGLATAAVKAVTKYGFEKYKLIRIIAQCRAYNKASARVLEKAGFKLEGILKKDAYQNGKYIDNMLWAKVK